MTLPEPDCWDLPGGGLNPQEDLLTGLRREVYEETGIEVFQVDGLVTVAESFSLDSAGKPLHTINIVYRCSFEAKPTQFSPSDLEEVGPKGIQWLPIATLRSHDCSTRTWAALQASGFVASHGSHERSSF
jgi:8-oxo-dGTP diphosphatase